MSVQSLQEQNNVKFSYDKAHDVLYVYIDETKISYEDETVPGIYIRISEEDETITGLIILDYKKKNLNIIDKYTPFKINFNEINKLIN